MKLTDAMTPAVVASAAEAPANRLVGTAPIWTSPSQLAAESNPSANVYLPRYNIPHLHRFSNRFEEGGGNS